MNQINDTTNDTNESIAAGEAASIENTGGDTLSLSLVSSNGCRVDLDLMPGQVLAFTAGTASARVVLHHGDPGALFIVKPESAS